MNRRILIGILVILMIVSVVSADKDVTFEVDEGKLVKLKLEARDPDEDQITYKFESPLDKNGEWQTTYKDAGKYKIRVTAEDSSGEESSEYITIIVNDINRLPDLSKIKDEITINEGELLDLKLPAKDIDDDVLKYIIIGPVNDNGKWQTDFEDEGEYSIRITAKDGKLTPKGKEASAKKTVTIIVNNVDRASDVESIEKTVFEGEEVEIKFPRKDPDGDKISYTADVLPEGAVLGSHEFGWTPSYDTVVERDNSVYIASYRIPLKKRKFSDAKRFFIPMTAVSNGLEKHFNITIYVKNQNRAPLISGIDDHVTIQETEEFILKANITDPDEDPVKISYFIGDKELKNNKFVTNYDSEGEYTITIRASDGNLTSDKEIDVTVENKNRLPYLKASKVTVNEGEKFSILIEAVDDDRDKVKIKARDLPEKVTYDQSESMIEFEPRFNFVLHNDNYSANFFDYSLNNVLGTKRFQRWLFTTFELDDGVDEVDVNFTIVVKDVNRAPVLEEIKKKIRVREGEELFIPLKGYDPDDDELSYKIKGLVNRNNQTIGFDKQGEHNIIIIVTDGQLEASTTAVIEVIDMNQPPKFKIGRYNVKEGETLRVPLIARDPDNDEIKFKVKDGPKGAKIDNNSLVWEVPYDAVHHLVIDENGAKIPNPKNYNEFVIVLAASDDDYDTIVNTTVKVIDVNQPPILKDWYPATRFRIQRGEKMEFFVNVEDPDGDELTYTWYPTKFRKIIDDKAHVRKLLTPGLRDFKVVVSDSKEEVEKAWQFYVK
ncbi:MAG: hypothetical protein KAT43_05010 [Nanoarchaeota archaeon]|nr:hypothetical protein [Nanoarchaeota archaeon]